MKNNVFTKEWTVFDGTDRDIQNAQQYSEMLYEAALRGDYKEVEPALCVSILKKIAEHRNQYGLIDICPGQGTCREARVAFMYQPSYTFIAAAIWLKNKHNELFDNEMDANLSDIMSASMEDGIVGHGFDRNEMIRRTMMVFAVAGTKSFIERNPGFSKVFTHKIKSYISCFEECRSDERISPILSMWNRNPEVNCYPVFVYGTLLSGMRQASMLDGSDYYGKYLLKDYAMYDLGQFPGIKPCRGESVCGELYFVSGETLNTLDSYEGEGSLYNRTPVVVENAEGTMNAEVYVYSQQVTGGPVRTPWNFNDDTPVWYAAYGSNLSEDRFRYYLLGGEYKALGKTYAGCRNKAYFTKDMFKEVPGKVYFGQQSGTWGGKGVAFFEESETETAVVRLYKITWGQLNDIQKQEGSSSSWYGKKLCLGMYEDGTPIYTLTSEHKHEVREPHEAYTKLIRIALMNEAKYSPEEADTYISRICGKNPVTYIEKRKESKEMSSLKIKSNAEVKKDKSMLNTTINTDVFEEFKLYCKHNGVAMNTLIELFMKECINEQYDLVLQKK